MLAVSQGWLATARRGYFRPWAYLALPEKISTFDFSYPTLILASHWSVFLWDAPHGSFIETIDGIQVGKSLGAIQSLEVNDRYAFVGGFFQLVIYARATSELVYTLAHSDLPWKAWRVSLPNENTARCSITRQELEFQEEEVLFTGIGMFIAENGELTC